MSPQAVNEYVIAVHSLYHATSKPEKGKILDHAEIVTKRSRDHLNRLLNTDPVEITKQKASGRPQKYPKEELLPHIRHLWIAMERICARRMKAGFTDWLPKYSQCPPYLRLQLQKISASTLERYLKEVRISEETKRGISSTSPARFMKNKVPINTLDHKITKPGYTQTDTVAHCGTTTAGQYINSLTVTDICSTWTENRALFTKKGNLVTEQLKDIKRALPFKLLAINSDSGSEFLNKEMLKFTNYGHGITFTRSRPYKKNDNCYVEQKNFTHVRELFGYERLEEEELVELMNDIYKNYWNPLQNFFIPTFKLKEKVRVGGRIKKIYDEPQTPYQRLINSPHLKEIEKDQLRERKSQLDPFELKRDLEQKLKEFFEIVRKKNIRKAA